MKIAIIDLDGIVADSSEWFSRAKKPDGKTNWKIALDPALVPLDTLIPGAAEALDIIDMHGYKVGFLTGRPEYMRDVTLDWLYRYGIETLNLVMRPEGDYRPASVFKREQVDRIIKDVEPEEIIFVDDMVDNILADLDYAHSYSSLATCIADLQKRAGWLYPDHPF